MLLFVAVGVVGWRVNSWASGSKSVLLFVGLFLG